MLIVGCRHGRPWTICFGQGELLADQCCLSECSLQHRRCSATIGTEPNSPTVGGEASCDEPVQTNYRHQQAGGVVSGSSTRSGQGVFCTQGECEHSRCVFVCCHHHCCCLRSAGSRCAAATPSLDLEGKSVREERSGEGKRMRKVVTFDTA